MHNVQRPYERDDLDIEEVGAQAAQWGEGWSDLSHSTGWSYLARIVSNEIDYRLAQLEMSGRDDERNRGAIEALRWVAGLPHHEIDLAVNKYNEATGATHG